jgi:predicted Rossmann-fold nucleotide-binding protein
MRVSVIGGSTVSDAEYEQAREVGRLLAERVTRSSAGDSVG